MIENCRVCGKRAAVITRSSSLIAPLCGSCRKSWQASVDSFVVTPCCKNCVRRTGHAGRGHDVFCDLTDGRVVPFDGCCNQHKGMKHDEA